MQFQLPLFPVDIKMVNDIVGIREQDGFVYTFTVGTRSIATRKKTRTVAGTP
ncbi:hypothetical protein [Proteiniphilum sp.]|uniref:hypothetical protein n=1 Tax=Proteiniphilum sp. TaxID=1926877 RepID=UPI003326F97F